MSSQSKMSAILQSPLTLIAAGLIVGFILGRVTAPISTAKHLQAGTAQKAEGKKKVEGALQDEDGESDDQQEYGDFTSNEEECKLVLVVRTDLGMTRGTDAPETLQLTPVLMRRRQNRSAMLPRDTSMLQSSAEAGGDQQEAVRDAAEMGVLGTGESHGAGQE